MKAIISADHSPPTRSTPTPPATWPAGAGGAGAMLLSKDAIADVVESLKVDDFYRPAHATVYSAILTCTAAGSLPTRSWWPSQSAGEISRIGGAAYLHDPAPVVLTAPTPGTTRPSWPSGRCCGAWWRLAPGSCRWGTPVRRRVRPADRASGRGVRATSSAPARLPAARHSLLPRINEIERCACTTADGGKVTSSLT